MSRLRKFYKAVICSVLSLALLTCGGCDNEERASFVPSEDATADYDNYQQSTLVDAEAGRFAVLSNKTLRITDSLGEKTKLKCSAKSFQLHNEYVFYVDKINDLYIKNVSDGKEQRLANNVGTFVVCDDLVVYATPENELTVETELKDLYAFNLKTNKETLLLENIRCFTTDGEYVFTITEDYDIYKTSLESYVSERYISLIWYRDNPTIALCGDLIVYTTTATSVSILNPANKKTTDVSLDGESKPVFDYSKVSVVCSDTDIFLSYQCIGLDGSIMRKFDSAINGLWKINAETLKKEKISSATYDKLYVIGSDLFAVDGQKVFKIDIKTGNAQRIE